LRPDRLIISMRAKSVSNIGVEVIFAYVDPGAGSMLT
jgi:hypothetical protein